VLLIGKRHHLLVGYHLLDLGLQYYTSMVDCI
jgi:hypothetical protein